MSAVEIRNLKEVTDFLSEMPERQLEQAKGAFQGAVLRAHATVQENCNSVLTKRTGALSRSIKTSVTGSSIETLRASLYAAHQAGGAEVVYAPAHEFGATIRAKDKYMRVPGGPYLNIPTDANKTTPAGVMRMSAREVFSAGGYLAKGPRRWVVMSGNGKPMFVLVKSVKIPPRLGMREAADNEVPTLLAELAK